jgi:hypothetical protein
MQSAQDREGQRAYEAFTASLNEFLPPVVQRWNEIDAMGNPTMHPRVRAAWIAAALAARNDPEES